MNNRVKVLMLLAGLLLGSCGTTETPDALSYTPLQRAAHQQDAAKVSQLITDGADVNAASEAPEFSPLCLAILSGDGEMETVQALLSAGARVTENELRQAVDSCYPQYVQAVLNAGGRIPHESAEWKGSIFSEFGGIGRPNENGRDCVACARILIEHGARLDEGSVSPLHYAVSGDKPELARYYLSIGMKVNAVTPNGDTPLAYSIRSASMVQLLVEAGANVNAQNKDGNTSIMYADIPLEAADALLQAGLDPNLRNNKGETALMYHLNNPAPTGGFYSDSSGAITGTWSSSAVNAELIQSLIRSGVDVNLPDNSGTTPLQAAQGNAEVCEMLRRAGAER